jgi:DNA-binding response OmpR family regulator
MWRRNPRLPEVFEDSTESDVVDRHIRNLRAKLQNDWHRPRHIATVPGPGLPLRTNYH